MTQLSNQKPNPTPKTPRQGNWWLISGVIVLIAFPLLFIKGEYNGADGQAHDVVLEIQPDYEPWFNTLTEPASGEVESFLFATQAALGAGAIGYIIGLYKGRKEELRIEMNSCLKQLFGEN